MQFLDRVTSLPGKLTKEMLDFDELALLEYDEIDDIIADVNQSLAIVNLQNVISEERKCRICCTNVANVCLVPCGCTYFCLDCYKEWDQADDHRTTTCPWCRSMIENYVVSRFH